MQVSGSLDGKHHPMVEPISFLTLPPELRNAIYDISLPNNHTFTIGPWRPNTRHMQPPLTMVCKQIRQETLPMFATRNIFQIRATTELARKGGPIQISPSIAALLERLDVFVCPVSTSYKVAITKNTHGIWTWDMDIYRAFHLPSNHVEVWSNWLRILEAHRDEDGHLRSKDLGIMVGLLQSWD